MGNVQQHIGKRTTIGRYEVEVVKYLGEGGSSFIFLVKDVVSASAKPMVLKRLLAENETTLAWIHSEIRMHQRFRHPQIVEFIASQTNRVKGAEREVFILMEYCPSGHLYENMMKMGEKRFTERELLRVFRQLCVPVSLLHQQDPPIAHRDLKLENFLMAANGVYKLCDFGSCVEGPQSLKTKEDRVRELESVDKRTTAMYRSPELADVEGTAMFGAGELTEAVDVWAMGCILYTMAFFKPPFPPDGLRTERYTIPEGSKYSADVHALIKRMLTADVELRATLDHVMECIDEMMEGRPMPPLRKGGSSTAKPAASAGAAKTRDSASAAAAATKKTAEARKETVPASSAKPAMDLLDMDFQATSSSSSTVSKTDSGSSAAWNVAPTDAFANFASFPSPTGGGSSGGGSSLDGKRMDAFGFPASPVKSQPPAFGFTPAAAAPPPVAAPPVDHFAELAAPAMGSGGGHFAPGAPVMGGAPGFTPAFQHHGAAPPPQQQQQFFGQQPQGFYPSPMQQQQQHAAQGFYQPQQHQQQQMWGAQPQQHHQQPQQQAFGGASAFSNTRF